MSYTIKAFDDDTFQVYDDAGTPCTLYFDADGTVMTIGTNAPGQPPHIGVGGVMEGRWDSSGNKE